MRQRADIRRPRRYSRWRAASLIAVHLLIALHIAHWKLAGRTLTPLELNEVMYTLELGIVTAGFLFMLLALASVLIFGRFFCSWGCHILALEDLCAWLLGKLRIRPRPVRSRVLLLVPPAAMFYMFIWPQISRLFAGRPLPLMHLRSDQHGWASFVTHDFWRNLPDPWVAGLTFLVCGFLIVYFLGTRAFCSYGCPYGAVFSLADRFAPGRIIAAGDCANCGACTAACQSHIRVHQEVAAFGKVVSPACLKDLDCVSVCPNGALRYGFAAPALFKSLAPAVRSKSRYEFTLVENALMAGVFVASLLTFRGLYERVPFLMSLALGAIFALAAVMSLRLLHTPNVRLNPFQLKHAGRWTRYGVAFSVVVLMTAAFAAHSAFVRYHHYLGLRGFAVMSRQPAAARPTADQTAAVLAHLDTSARWGLFDMPDANRKRAALHLSLGEFAAEQGDLPFALDHMRAAVAVNADSAAAHYNLGVMLNAAGRQVEATECYREAIRLDPGDADALNNLGLMLAQAGELEQASSLFKRAVQTQPTHAHAHFNLARILLRKGLTAQAQEHLKIAGNLDAQYAQSRESRGDFRTAR